MSGITGGRRRIALRCAVLSGSVILLLAPATPATAQAVWRDDAVPLVVRPPVGDTLWLQLEQTIERRGGRAASSSVPSVGAGTGLTDGYAGEQPPVMSRIPGYGPRQALASRHSTRFILYAHSLVESSDQAVTTLLATTDSLALWAATATESGNPEWLALPAGGRQVRVRVTPDGAMRLSDPPRGAAARGAMWSAMPALLPASPVRVGDQWVRDAAHRRYRPWRDGPRPPARVDHRCAHHHRRPGRRDARVGRGCRPAAAGRSYRAAYAHAVRPVGTDSSFEPARWFCSLQHAPGSSQ